MSDYIIVDNSLKVGGGGDNNVTPLLFKTPTHNHNKSIVWQNFGAKKCNASFRDFSCNTLSKKRKIPFPPLNLAIFDYI